MREWFVKGIRHCELCGTKLSSSAVIKRPRCGKCCRLERESKSEVELE